MSTAYIRNYTQAIVYCTLYSPYCNDSTEGDMDRRNHINSQISMFLCTITKFIGIFAVLASVGQHNINLFITCRHFVCVCVCTCECVYFEDDFILINGMYILSHTIFMPGWLVGCWLICGNQNSYCWPLRLLPLLQRFWTVDYHESSQVRAQYYCMLRTSTLCYVPLS